MIVNLDSNADYQDESDLLSLLANEYRRYMIKYMEERDRSEFEFDEIVDFLSNKFSEPEKQVKINMKHCHLSRLNKYGLIDDYEGGIQDEVFHYSSSEIHVDEDLMVIKETSSA